MGAAVLPVLFFTIFWGLIGIVVPIFLPRSENRQLLQVCIALTAICCYTFWLCTYMAQMNPLFGPMLSDGVLYMMDTYWGGHPPKPSPPASSSSAAPHTTH